MRAVNNTDKKEIQIQASYSEAHFIGEALSSHRFLVQRLYGMNSEEEKYIDELLYAIRNPSVKKRRHESEKDSLEMEI
ncbi:hypothetical protein JNUCC1_02234 [Lentibacillus sp. JNUCC-1]|uniref:hypothetical protein n=1 Tax=Lentibacillus sp. JNUCC-1 TaxID=2654513 RepID=UPI0012E7292B|nr:hypothetical protein [Lentibacillus sp. JNUCC-1]MUV38143.1 hypothetical protein [Lentibacillus sp. JNUCC-1]MUV38396.1 hypothetical protein [Lentibacillus sp. JNUCC-1]